MVPGSIFKYGSNFLILTLYFDNCNKDAIEEDAIPLPKDDTTPPVIKIYLVIINKEKEEGGYIFYWKFK